MSATAVHNASSDAATGQIDMHLEVGECRGRAA
jgi:hypothetical protein